MSRFAAAVASCDSVQVYGCDFPEAAAVGYSVRVFSCDNVGKMLGFRGDNIGTAKPAPDFPFLHPPMSSRLTVLRSPIGSGFPVVASTDVVQTHGFASTDVVQTHGFASTDVVQTHG